MRFFNAHIPFKFILKLMLGLAIFGTVFILLSVHRMNTVFSADLGFAKDSVISIKTSESPIVLNDTFVFSSELPGFRSKQNFHVKVEPLGEEINIAHQFVSQNFFDYFNYEIIAENTALFEDKDTSRLVYVNKSALKKLGIYNIKDAPGTALIGQNNGKLIICGVVEDYYALSYGPINQAKVFQLTPEHLAYAFINNSDLIHLLEKNNLDNSYAGYFSFQQRIERRNKINEDVIYSGFFFLNVLILLICLGYVGAKYANKKEVELVQVLGIGIQVITLLLSKTYVSLIAIIAGVIGPLAFVIQKFWLGMYAYRINFGWFNVFIILSMSLLTVYMICCPKEKVEGQFYKKPV